LTMRSSAFRKANSLINKLVCSLINIGIGIGPPDKPGVHGLSWFERIPSDKAFWSYQQLSEPDMQKGFTDGDIYQMRQIQLKVTEMVIVWLKILGNLVLLCPFFVCFGPLLAAIWPKEYRT
jgi:hypothetical protein